MGEHKTNMYIEEDVEVPTWNPLVGGDERGEREIKPCKHDCSYCYVSDIIGNNPMLRELYSGPLRLNSNAFRKDPKKLKRRKNPGAKDVMVFVGNMHDVFAEEVPRGFVLAILEHCNKFSDNTYLLQTKNPARLVEFWDELPPKAVLATTIESDSDELVSDYSQAPPISRRVHAMRVLAMFARQDKERGIETMVTIEPIMGFHVKRLAGKILSISPDKVYIGADSKLVCHNCGYGTGPHDDFRWRGKKRCGKCGSTDIGSAHNLPEPSKQKVEELIALLEEITEVRIKPNLNRILEE